MLPQDQIDNYQNDNYSMPTQPSTPLIHQPPALLTQHQVGVTIDSLTPALNSIADALATWNKKLEKTQQVGKSIESFNRSFSAFLSGMAVNSSTVEWTEAPTEQSIESFREHLKNKAVAIETPRPGNSIVNVETTKVENTPNRNKKSTSTINRKRKAVTEANLIGQKRRFVPKIPIKKIIQGLPLSYREQTDQNKHTKKLLEVLRDHPSGLSMKDLVNVSKLKQYEITDCVNALVHHKDVLKVNKEVTVNRIKGSQAIYMLDPEKYPSIPTG